MQYKKYDVLHTPPPPGILETMNHDFLSQSGFFIYHFVSGAEQQKHGENKNKVQQIFARN